MLREQRTKKRRFTVHFLAPTKQDLLHALRVLQDTYKAQIHGSVEGSFQTLDVEISPALFRKYQEHLPSDIVISYELSEPKKC